MSFQGTLFLLIEILKEARKFNITDNQFPPGVQPLMETLQFGLFQHPLLSMT